MKKKNLKNLAIKKITVSKINGGAATNANNDAAPDILSIGRPCSLRNSCKRVCGTSTNTMP